MGLFDRDRVDSRGLSIVELTIVGCAAAFVRLLSACLVDVIRDRSCQDSVSEWPRIALGIVAGVPLFGTIASKGLGLGLTGQLFSTAFAISGGGPALVIVVETLIRLLVRVLGG